ncbi:MAG: hypothetical protein WKF92_01185 [Pyrinomonadaceae bacterium]
MPADEEFLASVYAGTRSEELSLFGWDDEQQAAFCLMQFRLQAQSYEMSPFITSPIITAMMPPPVTTAGQGK